MPGNRRWGSWRGVRFGFDDHHPVGASHHQKIVVVDDQLAFCGGIDLTGHRWDTCAHRPDEPARVTPQGKAYGPYHEIQAMVSGPVAASLGELARDRWRALGAEGLPPVVRSSEDLWPDDIEPDLEGVRFLIVHPYDLDKEPTRNIVVVADRLGAGTGEMVMCAYGKAARSAIGNQDMSIEAAVVGIVDRVDINDTTSEEMREAARRLVQENGRP